MIRDLANRLCPERYIELVFLAACILVFLDEALPLPTFTVSEMCGWREWSSAAIM